MSIFEKKTRPQFLFYKSILIAINYEQGQLWNSELSSVEFTIDVIVLIVSQMQIMKTIYIHVL